MIAYLTVFIIDRQKQFVFLQIRYGNLCLASLSVYGQMSTDMCSPDVKYLTDCHHIQHARVFQHIRG